LRSAFAIGDGYVITAWHCIKGIDTSTRIWLRLQADTLEQEYVDVPLLYEKHVEKLDVALLVFDETAPSTAGAYLPEHKLRSFLDSVAIPLGTQIESHDRVRIGGFPERNPSRFSVMLAGTVDSAAATVGSGRAIRLHVPAFAAQHAEVPRGISGGPMLRRYPDGTERAVGVVFAFPPSTEGDGSLGGEVLGRHLADLRHAFPGVDHALQRSGPESKGNSGEVWASDMVRSLELAPEVRDVYRAKLNSGTDLVHLPVRWNLAELSRLRQEVATQGHGVSKVADTLAALCEAVRAKQVFLDVGGGSLELGRLQVMYRREIGAWSNGNSADALLVEAADVDLVERRTAGRGPLGALARFMVSVGSALGVAPDSCGQLAEWVTSLGHQIADAQQHFLQRRDSKAWLLIDLGDEPTAETPMWPTTVTWTRFSRSVDLSDIAGVVSCDGTEDGLRQALREVLRIVPPARPLLVDLAVPYALLHKGVEHWEILKVDDDFEALSNDCRPRLRWSRRHRDLALHNRLLERTSLAAWGVDPTTLPEEIFTDRHKLRRWIREETPPPACLVGGASASSGTGLLRILLREGCGFVVWFPHNLDHELRQKISDAVHQVPTPARRGTLPDELPDFEDQRPVIIWEDPNGRDDFNLPQLVLPESL
jgi:hypothetical protein